MICLDNTLMGVANRAQTGLLLLPGIGLGAAGRKFVEVMGITWAGSQITKVTSKSHHYKTSLHTSAAQKFPRTFCIIADVPVRTGAACTARAVAEA